LLDPVLHEAFVLDRPLRTLKTNRAAIARMLEGGAIRASAGILLEELSRRIPGLAGASHGYVRRNALALHASIERHGTACVVRLGRAPLDILLVLAGAKSGRIVLPGATIELRAEHAG